MRKLVVTENITVDGVIDATGGWFDPTDGTVDQSDLMEQTQQAATGAREAMTAYSGTVQKAAEDLRAVSASTNIAATGVSQFVSAWFEWAGKVARTNAEVSRRMLQSRNVTQFAEAHQEYVTSATRNLIEGNSALLEIAQRTSKEALRPLEGQLAR